MSKERTLTQKRLKELLYYDPCTGEFTRKLYTRGPCKSGSVANGHDDKGYIRIRLDGKKYRAHRLAWLYVYGYFPERDIDHEDRIRDHNWIDNLREASDQCNIRNSKLRKDNKTGIKGVYWLKLQKKWAANIRINGKGIGLGCYSDKIDAAKSRYIAELKYEFPNCDKTSTALKFIKDNS